MSISKKKPRYETERGLPRNRWRYYFLALLEALSGLIFCFLPVAMVMWDARLQFPFFHFSDGSGHAVQYQPAENSWTRLHPLQVSTVSWQSPPL
jgi:hypothetical protein